MNTRDVSSNERQPGLLQEAQRNAWLPFWIGLTLMLSGWFAAMTTVGAQFIYAGTALILLAMLLSRRPAMLSAGIVALFFGWGGPMWLLYYLT